MNLQRSFRIRRRGSTMLRPTIPVLVLALLVGIAGSAGAGTLDRVRETGKLRLGYRVDARPFSYKDESGNPAGYTVALCQRVAEAVKAQLGLATLGVDYVEVGTENRLDAIRTGKVDLLCGAATVTLERRKVVSFSIPIFPSGVGALLRTDAPPRLRDILAGRPAPERPVWRASLGQILARRTFAVVPGTTTATWLDQKLQQFEIIASVSPVSSYEVGVQQVLDRKADVFFADRAILLDTASRSPSAADLHVLDRLFTYEPLALGLQPNDDAFRLVIDRALSDLYRSGAIDSLYENYFGKPDANARTFFRLSALPD